MNLLAWGATWKTGAWRSGAWESAETPAAVVAQYTGGWPEPPDEEAVRRQRERMGILPPAAPRKAPQRAAQAVTASPYEWREPSFAWSDATDLRRVERTLDQLADEAQFADLVAAGRIAAALQAAQERRAALLREEEDLAYVVAALAEGLGTPVTVLAPAAPATPEEDLAFVIAALAAIA